MSSALVARVIIGVLEAGCAVYALLDLVVPGLTIRWQVRSTARAKGSRRVVGETFASWFGVDRSPIPWDDPAGRRRVRLLGFGMLVATAVSAWVFLAGSPGTDERNSTASGTASRGSRPRAHAARIARTV